MPDTAIVRQTRLKKIVRDGANNKTTTAKKRKNNKFILTRKCKNKNND